MQNNQNTRTKISCERLLTWYAQHGRTDLPWKNPPHPYPIWISEVMLQQTQVNTVIPYFQRFIKHFPDIFQLAHAKIDEVLYLWSGLGYYARCRNLHKTAKIICHDLAGQFPKDFNTLISLPGIGRTTASAILALAYEQPYAILDGNVRRVLIRYHAITQHTRMRATETTLWKLAEQALPQTRIADYTQAIMDLGATVCTHKKPNCEKCPMSSSCCSYQKGLQYKLPIPHNKPHRQTKKTIFIVIQRPTGEILLKRQPASGIWGGLWIFPTFNSQSTAKKWLMMHSNEVHTSWQQRPSFDHAFTHLKLEITPIYVYVNQFSLPQKKQYNWYHPNTPTKLGLPQPVKRLLANI